MSVMPEKSLGSLMCTAASSGDLDKLKYVTNLKEGAAEALEFQNSAGLTPLLIACNNGRLDCIRLLLENGANLRATSKKGDDCLSLANKSGNEATISFIRACLDELKEHGACLVKLKTELITRCSKQSNSVEELTRLDELVGILKLSNGLNEELFDGEPLIIRACKVDNEQLIYHLVDKLNMPYIVNDNEGRTILHIAVMKKSEMRYTITKRFPEILPIIDTYSQTLFHAACANNDIDYIKWLFDLVIKKRNSNSQTPPLTPIVTADVVSSLPEDNLTITAEEYSTLITADSTHDETDSGLEVFTSSPPRRGFSKELSSSDIKLVLDDVDHDVPTGPLFPVNYHQYVEKMKLFAADTNGQNILHVMVKNDCHELMAYIFESWPKLGVRAPTTRDFWLRATDMESPLDEAIAQNRHQCLDVMLDAIVNQCDPSRLYKDESLLLKGVCSRSTEIIMVLIRHGVHCGLDTTLHVSGSMSEVLPILLFYKEVVGLIKDGKKYLMENSCTLTWCEYLLYTIDPVWIHLASHAVEIVKELFAESWDPVTNHSLFMAAGKAVIKLYTKLISQPLTYPIGKCFTTVILSGNELTSIPVELLNLPNLKTLDLSSNCIEELPNGDAKVMSYSCHCLNTLTINNNQLTTLPGKLFLLPQLEVIGAQHNKIEDLPTAMWISISLLTFNLSDNKLSRLHDLSGSQLFRSQQQEGLQPDNSLKNDDNTKLKLDMFIAQLKYRETLTEKRKPPNENDGSYDDCDSTLFCCLKSLNLSSNSFTKVPTDLPCLAPKLERLWMNNNPINEVDLIRDFPADLSMLNMQSCGLTDVSVTRSESIPCGGVSCLMHSTGVGEYCEHCNHKCLAKLNTLSLKNNNITSLQVANIMSDSYQALFPVLSVLDISNNQISHVPDHLELLTELTSLYLSDNNITFLPSSISELCHLWVINVENLTLSNIPRAILSTQSGTELKNYLKHLHQNSQPYRRMKLMFVGESNKGKTSLLLALTKKGKVNHYQEVQLNVSRKPLSTVGVDLGDWEYAKQTGLLSGGGAKKIMFMTWDFGGQEEYYATHQCFLSPHALYVLVWNVLDGEDGLAGLRPWLENIESRAKGAQVIVVATHIDLCDAQSRHIIEKSVTKKFRALYVDCDRRQCKTYPRISEKIYFVDTSNKDHINMLRDVIYDHASEYWPSLSGKKDSISQLEEFVPASYVSLEETVRQLAASLRSDQQIPILTHQEFINQVSTTDNNTKMTQTELRQAVSFLHEKGILLHYDEGRLSDLYFVDPQWLCSMLAKVIAVPEVNSFHKNGFIGRTELDRIFGDRSHVSECINLMHKFDLLFEMADSLYLIPSLLPPVESQSCVVFPRSLKISDTRSADRLLPVSTALMGPQSNCLVRLFMLPFIPNGMFPRLSARLIATDVIEYVLSCMKVKSLENDQHCNNQPHWRVWRNGITLVYHHMQIFRIVPVDIPLPGVDLVHVIQSMEIQQPACNIHKGVSIMVQVGNLSDDIFNKNSSRLQMATWLLQQAVEQINSVFEDWYEEFAWKRGIDLNVVAADPCPKCMTEIYEQLIPDLAAAQKMPVDKPQALGEVKKEKKKSPFLRTMTLLRKQASKSKKSNSETHVSFTQSAIFGANSFSRWSSGGISGLNKKVVYLFSVKLSALSVMEATTLTCPTHGSISIAEIAPDMIFADLALSMQINPGDVTQKHYLDEGGFGCVYLATVKLQGGETKQLAIKTFTQPLGNLSKAEIAWHHYQSANSEGRIMASLHHPNILPLMGIVFQPIRLLLEFAPMGSLNNIVGRYSDNHTKIGRYVLQKVICQLSSAMEYLHNNKIIYRDLKPGNVLVWKFPEPHAPQEQYDVEIKLADYGISKQVVPWGMRGMMGTPPYLPPEVILFGGKQVYTFKIDVYSFGILLFYLFTFIKPFGKISHPLRSYLKVEMRPEMSPKHRPSCQMMYELMCWCWSSKPHHRPSFSVIRELASCPSFTRLHHAMPVKPQGHVVTSATVRYYKVTGNEKQRPKYSTLTRGTSATKQQQESSNYGSPSLAERHHHKSSTVPLEYSPKLHHSDKPVDSEATEVWYGTAKGVVGVADLQQSSVSSQVVYDMKSPISCMASLEGNVWVGSSSGVIKVLHADSKLPVGHWDSKLYVTNMIHLPVGCYHEDKEALVILANPSTIAVFTKLDIQAGKLVKAILPDRALQLGGDPIFAIAVPAAQQLWVCTADGQLNVFSSGCYDNPMKYDNPYGACCMASEEGFVLIASGSTMHKWSQPPSHVASLNCEDVIMKKIPNYNAKGCYVKTMVGLHGDMYVGTKGGAIFVVGVAKMAIHRVLHLQDSPVNSLLFIKQFHPPKVKTTSMMYNHQPEDDILLVNFALSYHGVSQYSECHPPVYNYPQMTSLGRYQQPVVTPDSDDLYMLMWSAHSWTV